MPEEQAVPESDPETEENTAPEAKEVATEEKALPFSNENKEEAGEKGFNLESAVKEIASAFPVGTRVIMTDPSAVKWELEGDQLRLLVKTEFNRRNLDTPEKRTGIEKRFEELFGRKVRVTVSGVQQEQRNARDLEELKKFDIVQDAAGAGGFKV